MWNVRSLCENRLYGRVVLPALSVGIGLILVAAAPSTARAQASGSKLGPHLIMSYTTPCNQFISAKPRVIKVLNSDGTMMQAIRDAKALAPDCISVVRIYTTRSYNVGQSPSWAAQDFWNYVLAPPLNALSPSDRALVDYVEGPNEGDSTPTWGSFQDAQWYSDFWVALAPLIGNAGFRPCAFSIAVGNPPGSLSEIHQYLDILAPALRVCKQYGGGWSYHSYTLLYTTDLNTELWYSLRYRQYYDYFATAHPDLVDLPIIFTEGGVDGQTGSAGSGWMGGGDAAKYQNWLDWFDARMREDAYALGCTLFQTGSPGWESFNTDPISPWLASHLNSIPSGPPAAPTGLIATAGDGQVMLDWNSSAGATSYDVKRSTVSGGPYSIVADNITTTSHTDTGLANGTTYYYVVSAANGQGESGNSSEASATPAQSSNLIANGDFSNGLTGWSRWLERGTLNETAAGGQLHMQSSNHNGGMYQQFNTGGTGTEISISGYWASNPTAANYQWAEVLIINGSRQPVDGQDINGNQADVEIIYKNDTWATPAGWSGNMDQTAPVVNVGSFTAAGSVATIILKSGNLGGQTSGTIYDDIVVTAGEPPTDPTISLDPASLSPQTDQGSSPPAGSFTVTNTGAGTLQYAISDNVSWLSCTPTSGTSTGEADTITVNYSTASLAPGSYNATITVSDPAATNNPQTVAVSLTVNALKTTVAEDFESMPSWSSSFNAAWGSAASWAVETPGQSGKALRASRSSQGSSVKVKVYTIDANTNYTIRLYIRCPSFGGSYWAECAYRLGSYTAQNFDQSSGSWTMIKKFSNDGANGNGDTFIEYSKTFNSGSNTQISVGCKLGSSGGGGPTVRWDTLRID